jgi:hypothetical protein
MDLSNNVIYDNYTRHEDIINKTNILLFSSLFFTTNILTAFLKEYYLYSVLFCFLTLTSLIYHSKNNIYTKSIDKLAILSIVIYGTYIVYDKRSVNNLFNCLFVVFIFLACIYLYFYGFITKQYCFCSDIRIAQKYHFTIHIISSIGHHFIIFL